MVRATGFEASTCMGIRMPLGRPLPLTTVLTTANVNHAPALKVYVGKDDAGEARNNTVRRVQHCLCLQGFRL